MGFTKLNLHEKILRGIKEMGFEKPTEIQKLCIPEIQKGKDIVGQSLTGSGKTAAFGLPILEMITPGKKSQVLILTPTRELCIQIRNNLEQMGKYTNINIISIFGGVGYHTQRKEANSEIIVATPGRLLDLINQRIISLKKSKIVVLDEADRMFDMGFEKDVNKILNETPKSRQTILFSATMPKAAQRLINKFLTKPVYLKHDIHVDKSLLNQIFYSTTQNSKFSLLIHLLKEKKYGKTLIFCGTKRQVDRLTREINKQGFKAKAVHGDKPHSQRQYAVKDFKDGKIDLLIATDVAARGIDIENIEYVYNYDVPRTAEDYTHRIGRTARAGKKGEAITLLSQRDLKNLHKIHKDKNINISQKTTPKFDKIEIKKDFSNDKKYPKREKNSFSKKKKFYDKRNKKSKFNKYSKTRNSVYKESKKEESITNNKKKSSDKNSNKKKSSKKFKKKKKQWRNKKDFKRE